MGMTVAAVWAVPEAVKGKGPGRECSATRAEGVGGGHNSGGKVQDAWGVSSEEGSMTGID